MRHDSAPRVTECSSDMRNPPRASRTLNADAGSRQEMSMAAARATQGANSDVFVHYDSAEYEGRVCTLGRAPRAPHAALVTALFQNATIMNTMPSAQAASHTVPVTLRVGNVTENAPGSLSAPLNHEEAMVGPQTSSVTVRPRIQDGGDSQAVVLTVESIRPLFQYQQVEAANILGIAPCSLRQACQRLGIGRWPWRQLATTNPSDSMLLRDDDGRKWKRQNSNSDGLLDEALDAV